MPYHVRRTGRKQPKRKPRNKQSLQKPNGVISPRVRKVGGEHFAIVCVDPAKHRSEWMMADYFGNLLIEHQTVEHQSVFFNVAVEMIRQAQQQHDIQDMIVVVERTGNYHLPPKRAFASAGFETRVVHPPDWLPFASLLAVMAVGFIILEKDEHMAHEISAKLGKIWVFAEIVLFTMVGAQVNIEVALAAGLMGAVIIALGLVARSIGTYACLIGSDLNFGERMFVVISYLPKATVQAAIGGVPIAALAAAGMDTGPGEVILAVAVLSILLTAPLGAWAIALTGERVLEIAPPPTHDARDAVIESRGAEDEA